MSSDKQEKEKKKSLLTINVLPLTDFDKSSQQNKDIELKTQQDGLNANLLTVPNKIEEELIFTSAMEKGLKFNSLEQSFKPILATLKQFITDYTTKLGLRQNEIARNESANQCLIEYNTLMEYQCYDLIRVALEFVLTDECEIAVQIKPTKTKKYKSQMFISKIKQHFKTKRRGSLQTLFNKLYMVEKSNKLNYFADDSEEEGFFDQNSFRDDSIAGTPGQLKIKNDLFQIKSLKVEFVDNDISYLRGNPQNEKFKELKDRITDLEYQIKLRDEQIQQVTTGYIKDVSHMKEMMFQLYEVQYFDGTQNLDEQTRLALNDKLRTLKQNFENKTREYVKKLVFLNEEHDKLKKSYNKIAVNKGDTTEMFKKIFEAQDNPYLLWKQIQEIKGNKFFFDVFERQRPEYGINYKEVNQMLMSKRAYEKEYSYYKEQNDDSLCNLIKKCTDELEEIKQQLNEKEEEMIQLKSEQKEDKKSKQDKMIANMKVFLDLREEDFYTRYENQKAQWMNQEEQDKQMCVNKIIKCKGLNDNEQIMKKIKEILTKNPYQNDIIKNYEAKIKEIEEDKQKAMSKYNELNLQIIYEQTEREEIQAEKTVLQEEILNLRNKVQQLKEDNKNKENKAQLYQNTLINVFKHIGLKIDDSQFENNKKHQNQLALNLLIEFNIKVFQIFKQYQFKFQLNYYDITYKQIINLDDENKTSTKAFKKKMSKIDKISLRRIREENVIGEKAIEAHEVIFKNVDQKSQGTMTDLLNVDIQITYQNTVDKQIKQQKQELADKFQLQFENLQAQIQNDLLIQQQAYEDEIQNLKQNNNQSKDHSRIPSALKSEHIQNNQSQSKSSIQESEIADDIEPQLNQLSLNQERKVASQVFGLASSQRKQQIYLN